MWGFITKWEAIYYVSSSRGHQVPLGILGKNPKGVDVHDRFSAYKPLWRLTGERDQQLCWAHILCNAKELEEFDPEGGGEVINYMLHHIYREANLFENMATKKDVRKIQNLMRKLLAHDWFSEKCKSFVKNLLKDMDFLFTFMTNPDVESTNNRAERGLRPLVIDRKVTGGSRSIRGAQRFSLLASVIQTFKIRGLNLFDDGPSIMQTAHG